MGKKTVQSPICRSPFMITADISRATDSFGKAYSFAQPQEGYHFTQDTVALADFIQIHPHETLLDLCAGVAAIHVLVWRRCPFASGLAVEILEEPIRLARQNLDYVGLQGRVQIIQEDVCRITPQYLRHIFHGRFSSGFDVVSANPPFHKRQTGRLNPLREKAVARHELLVTLPELIHTASSCLKPGGRFYLVHRADRRQDILAALVAHQMKVAREESPKDGRQRVKLILLESVKPA
jgi:tRNA1Val (adenine37-N6)-methyltransferase